MTTPNPPEQRGTGDAPMHLCLCEFAKVVPQPNRLYRPILFQGAMVRALLAGTKTQTRRVFKQATGPSLSVGMVDDAPGIAELSWLWGDGPGHEVHESISFVACPYGAPGDQLWVRETFFAFGRWETRFSAKKGRDEWHFVDMALECGHEYSYPADGRVIAPYKRSAGVTPTWWTRPAIFMPRAASRITLEITCVRVERLQDISDTDAQAEGTPCYVCEGALNGRSEADCHCFHRKATASDYRGLWEQINGPGSWEVNPWVWVVEFRMPGKEGISNG